MKQVTLVAPTLMLAAVLITACNQPYSQAPAVTNTPINPQSLFATPATDEAELSDVEIFATQTARSIDPSLLNTATPDSALQTPTVTLTPFVQLPTNPALTPSATLAIPSGGSTSTPVSVPAGSRPPTYTLQSQEFPFCIARRYNLDPDSLIAQNGLSSGTIYYAGYQLNLSNVASPFPGDRALQAHPTTYTVTGNADTTVYGVACKFGDVEPSAIVSANSSAGITLGSTLTAGQTLNIP
jgi:LysM repeat protein